MPVSVQSPTPLVDRPRGFGIPSVLIDGNDILASYTASVVATEHARSGQGPAFIEADKKTRTGLDGYLKSRGIETVYVTGLATDFCVAWTAMDARALGFEAIVIEDATRAIDLNGSLAKAWEDMAAKGVKRIRSSEILG